MLFLLLSFTTLCKLTAALSSPASSTSIKTIPFLQILRATSSRSSPGATTTHVFIAALYSKSLTPCTLWEFEGDVHEAGHDREEREEGRCRVEWFCQELEKRAYVGE